jgi:hydrogenase-4 component E
MITHDLLIQIAVAVLCLATVGLHAAKKNFNEVVLYAVQSLAIVVLLADAFVEDGSTPLLLVVLLTLLVKVILAPMFFARLIKRHKLKFTVSTYTSIPGALAVITLILLLVNSGVFAPLTNLVPEYHSYLVLTLAMLLASIFLMVNRRGALSQVVGVLSLENSIVAFGIFAGLEQSAALQAGIVFDVFVWSIIAIVMVSMVYRHIGSLDVTTMKDLKD